MKISKYKIICSGRAAGRKHMQELIEEYHNLMRAGLDEIAIDDIEIAEEYFSDAAFVLNKIENKEIRDELATTYTVNPLDFAK